MAKRLFRDDQIIRIRNDTRSLKAIAHEFGVSKVAIHKIKRGVTYKHVSFPPAVTVSVSAENSSISADF